MELLAPGSTDIAVRLAYGYIWWSLPSRLRFLDDCTVGDSWAIDGMSIYFSEKIPKVTIDPGSLESSKNRLRHKYLYSGYGRI